MPGGEGAGALPNSSADTSNVRGALFALPLPPPLDIHDSNAAEKWEEFEQAWKNYSIAMKLHQEPSVQVATLLSVVGAEVQIVFAVFTDWASDTDQNNLEIIFVFSPIPEISAMLFLCIYTRKPLTMLICAM